jgi:hypothetical protein
MVLDIWFHRELLLVAFLIISIQEKRKILHMKHGKNAQFLENIHQTIQVMMEDHRLRVVNLKLIVQMVPWVPQYLGA